MRAHLLSTIVFGVILFAAGCEKSRSEFTAEQDSTAAEQARTSISVTPAFQEITEPQVELDLAEVRERRRLVALTGYSASSYFIYKGKPMGFEYELLQRLADHLNVELDIVIVRNLDQIFSMLNRGDGDLVAYNMTVTKDRLKQVGFTDHHTLIKQVLIQRKPDDWRKMKLHDIQRQMLTTPVDLIGKQVYVRKGSSYYPRLQNLSDEIGGDIEIIEVPGDVSTEELIGRVSSGEIDYTVADENVAQINAGYYQNIDISVPVSLPQRIAWAIRNNSPELAGEINQWLTSIRYKPTFNLLYNKYHKNKRFYAQRVSSDFFSMTGTSISEYDDRIKDFASSIGWDWRLLASQIYQESEFDPKATSWVGARGLMQLMPATGKQFGATNSFDVEQNLKAGTGYLKWLGDYWQDIADSTERLKFVLASYNAGQGHVSDARKLAEKYGKDPNVWDENVAVYLLKKSQRQFFNDEVCQFGYCRGSEPFEYVTSILERYRHYKKFIVAQSDSTRLVVQ